MASTDATVFPVKGQAFRITGVILNGTTGNAITGGLTVLAGTASKDGAAFSAIGVTVAEIDTTTGYFTVDLTSTVMNAATVVVQVSATNANAVYWKREIKTVDLSEKTGHWYAQTVKKVEDMWSVMTQYIQNRVTQNNSSENIEVHAYGSTSTILWTNVVDNDGTDEVKAQAS